MMAVFAPRRLAVMAGLTVAWCALWGNVSVANIASGLIVSGVASNGFFSTPHRGPIRVGAAIRLFGLIAWDLITSTAYVAREILTPTDYTEEQLVPVSLPPELRGHVLLLVVAVTLTPGTAVIDVDDDTGELMLHLLHGERTEATVAHVHELATLAEQAFPTVDEVTS